MKRRLLVKSTKTIEALPKKGVKDRKEIETEINVNWPCIPVVKSVKQLSCKKGIVCFSSSSLETFVVAITLLQCCYVSMSVAVSLTRSSNSFIKNSCLLICRTRQP